MARPRRGEGSREMSMREVVEEGLLTSKEPHDIVSVKEIIIDKELGVFAKKMIEPKTFIAEYKGDLLTREEAEEKEQSYQLVGQKIFYQLKIATNKVIDATNQIGTIGRLVNHAPKPHANCVGVVVDDKVAIISQQRISPNEQLTWDYGFRSKDLPWLKQMMRIAQASATDVPLQEKSKQRYSQCPICLTMTESARASAHIKRHHSLNEEERQYYLAEMLQEKHSSKDGSQERKRNGSTRGMALFERTETTRKDLSDLIEQHGNPKFLKYLNVVGESEPFGSQSLETYLTHLRGRGVGVSGLISNIEGILEVVEKSESEHGNFIRELKEFLKEKRREKKRKLRRRAGFDNPMTVQIQKFAKCKELTGMINKISENGKIETEDEEKVAKAYALSRAGCHNYSKIKKTNEPMNGEIEKILAVKGDIFGEKEEMEILDDARKVFGMPSLKAIKIEKEREESDEEEKKNKE